MLTTFVPTNGPWAGKAYTLPPIKGELKTATHINRQQNAYSEIEEAVGVVTVTGTRPLYPSYGEIQAVFSLEENYLLGQGYGFNYSGLMTAFIDFMQAVVNGGQGILTDTLPAGTKNGLGGGNLTSRTCTAEVDGDYTQTYMVGAPMADLTVTLIVPDVSWFYQPGNIQVPFH